MKRFLQFRLGCHELPIATGRRTGVARACRLCTFCDAGAVGDEKHLVFECAQLAPLRAKYADLFIDKDHTMCSFLAQRDHLGVFHYVIDCLDLMDKYVCMYVCLMSWGPTEGQQTKFCLCKFI